jgi:tyrosinase
MARLRLSLLLTLLCFANTLVVAQYSAYNYGFNVKKRVKRQLDRRSTMIVQERTGGDIQVRQEIRQVEKDQDLWTLYILGLSMLQYTDQASPMSYYGLAGMWFFRYCTWP